MYVFRELTPAQLRTATPTELSRHTDWLLDRKGANGARKVLRGADWARICAYEEPFAELAY